MLALYYFDSCPYCRKVLRAIDELKIRPEIEFRDIHGDPKLDREIRQYQAGRAQVPMLLIDGKPLLESDDIIAYLRDRFGPKLA